MADRVRRIRTVPNIKALIEVFLLAVVVGILFTLLAAGTVVWTW